MQPVAKIESSNRVTDALQAYAVDEAQLIASNPVSWRNDMAAMTLKYQWYSNVAHAYSSGLVRRNKLNHPERQSLRYVRHELKRMDAVLKPNGWKRFLFHPVVDLLRSFITGRHNLYKSHTEQLEGARRSRLHDLNLQALRHTMQQAGFTNAADTTLQKMMQQGFSDFHFRYSDLRCKNTDFVLHFEKIPGSDYYYFKSFDASSAPELRDLFNSSSTAIRQTFNLHSTVDFTAAEAAVLVNKGHVCKTIEGKERWVALDLTQQPTAKDIPLTKYSFDLSKALHKLPLKTLSEAQFSKLVAALKEGARRTVDLLINNKIVKCAVKAAPHINQLLVFDKNNRPFDVAQASKAVLTAIKQQENTLQLSEEIFTPPIRKKKIK